MSVEVGGKVRLTFAEAKQSFFLGGFTTLISVIILARYEQHSAKTC